METVLSTLNSVIAWLASEPGWLVVFAGVPLLVFLAGTVITRRRRGGEDMVARQIRQADQARREATR